MRIFRAKLRGLGVLGCLVGGPAWLLTGSGAAHAWKDEPNGASTCFDFASFTGVKPLASPIAFSSRARPDTIASGQHPQGGSWGAARALIDLSIMQVLDLLRDQTTLKDPKDSEVSVKHLDKRPGLIDLQSVDITIHPFPLISIDWTESWAYRVIAGTELKPREVLIAYQKTGGTDHIKHFCGNIWLKSDGPSKTDFAVYEETEAYRRTPEAIAQGHLGTIRTIRSRAEAEATSAAKHP